MSDFEKFPKIPRLNRECVISEKIDGTNSQILFYEDGHHSVGSRNRIITPGKSTDNYGFAGWVQDNLDTLWTDLGPGLHFGEWWGQGIARAYDLDEKRFSLFNTSRWADASFETPQLHVVPELHRTGPDIAFIGAGVDWCLEMLQREGSVASKGFMRPEGIVVFHTAANQLFKVTIEGDEKPKGSHEQAF